MPRPSYAPPMIRTDRSNAFANNAMRVRLPGALRRILDTNPDYPASIKDELQALHDEIIADAPIPWLVGSAPDYDSWTAAYEAHRGHTWQNTDWFFAEVYAYRLIIQATRWWETYRDPFLPIKAEENHGDDLWQHIDKALAIGGPTDERLQALLHQDLWSNRIDLSFKWALAHGVTVSDDDLLIDDSAAVVRHLIEKEGAVHIVADNAGRELAIDIVLADALLDTVADRVTVHLKTHPTFVSDATVTDTLEMIDLMKDRSEATRHLGQRLIDALEDGRLCLTSDLFWNSSTLLWDLPPHLANLFKQARLVILKGDMNYRRMAGDALWPDGMSFAEGVSFFPAPLLALRSLKSEPLIGVDADTAVRLDATDKRWRVNGKHGIIQAKLD